MPHEPKYWSTKADDVTNYQVMEKENGFTAVCIWIEQGQRRSQVLGEGYGTLAEAQKICEEHFRDHFGG